MHLFSILFWLPSFPRLKDFKMTAEKNLENWFEILILYFICQIVNYGQPQQVFLIDKGVVASHIITLNPVVDIANHIIFILSKVLVSLKAIHFEEGLSCFYFTSNKGYHGIKLIILWRNNFWNIKKKYERVNETDGCDWQ